MTSNTLYLELWHVTSVILRALILFTCGFQNPVSGPAVRRRCIGQRQPQEVTTISSKVLTSYWLGASCRSSDAEPRRVGTQQGRPAPCVESILWSVACKQNEYHIYSINRRIRITAALESRNINKRRPRISTAPMMRRLFESFTQKASSVVL